MYQGDTPFWGGKNPSLWPLVGNTLDGTYEVYGKKYEFICELFSMVCE